MITENQNQSSQLDLQPENLNGHTVEELSDYLDAGRSPRDDTIEQSAGCRLALEALERLRQFGIELVAADGPSDETWVQRIMNGIAIDARAGRRIPYTSESGDLGITEGAVRGVIRRAELAVPGVLIGRCLFDGDVTDPAATIRVTIDISVPYGEPIAEISTRMRAEIAARLAAHTELRVVAIDINVHDISDLPVANNAKERG